MIGTQATITPGNLPSVMSMTNRVQLDNYHLFDSVEDLARQEQRVEMLKGYNASIMAILYIQPEDDPEDIRDFCKYLGSQDIDIIQLAQEPDLTGGIYPYFGGWGIGLVQRYVEVLNTCLLEIPSTKVITLGLSLNHGWKDWLSEFYRLGGRVDAIGLHYYAVYPHQYNSEELTDSIQYARQYGNVWITEIGYRYNWGDLQQFEASKVVFINRAIPDAFAAGAQTVYYYGYNPGWDYTDLKNNPAAMAAIKELQANVNNVTSPYP